MDEQFVQKYAKSHRLKCVDCDEVDPVELCAGTKRGLQASQIIVHAIAKMFANNAYSDARGCLVYHSTGSGKTCSATAIMDAFWNSSYDIIFVTSPSALQSNPPATYHDCARLFPRFRDRNISSMFDEKIQFTTFAKLAHKAALYRPNKETQPLRESIFIIDEAHTLFQPLPTQQKEMEAVVQYLSDKSLKNKLFLLTATPGQTVHDILALLNLLTVSRTLVEPVSFDESLEFLRDCRHIVSHYDASKTSLFPSVHTVDVKTQMSIAQYTRYSEALKHTDLQKIGTSVRRFSNGLFKKDGLKMAEYSPKLAKLLHNIMSHPHAKHYVYSSFGDDCGSNSQGIYMVAHALKLFGYVQLDYKQAAAVAKFDDLPILKRKRFVVLTGKELGTNKDVNLSNIVNVVNKSVNANGAYVQIVLASQRYNESIDLKTLRYIHIFDPLMSHDAYMQTVGRGARRCSHSQLRRSDWNVTVVNYISTTPDSDEASSIDEQISKALADDRPVARLLKLLQIAALDCSFFKGLHHLKGPCVAEFT